MNTYKTISDTLKRISAALRELAVKIHENPETGFNEFKACEWQTELLEKLGFKVKTPFAGLKTAYFAEKGSGRPHVCFPAEFDALPGLGHACGHNLIAPASIGAAIILSELLEKEGIKGSVSVAGTPAEEGKGGKLYFISAGAFKSVDLAEDLEKLIQKMNSGEKPERPKKVPKPPQKEAPKFYKLKVIHSDD